MQYKPQQKPPTPADLDKFIDGLTPWQMDLVVNLLFQFHQLNELAGLMPTPQEGSRISARQPRS
jgi:hypothetical protein